MIKVTCDVDKIVIEGHANYNNYGNDIVCAAVSTSINVTVNGVLRIDKNAIQYKDDGKKITIINIKKDNITNSLLDNLKAILLELSKQYPKNIKIEMEEE